MDWGLHTDDVTLARPKAPPHAHPSHVPNEKVFSVRFFCNFHKLLKGEASALRPTAGFRQRPWIHLPLPVHSSGLNSSLT